MANEVSVRVSLGIRKGNLQYQSNPQVFNGNMDTETPKGTTPGSFSVSLDGVACDLSNLLTPGWVWLQNLDAVNYVEYGIRDPITGAFYPLGELLPGMPQALLFSRNLLENYTNTGTGTTGSVNQFWLKANGAACDVIVHAFEK